MILHAVSTETVPRVATLAMGRQLLLHSTPAAAAANCPRRLGRSSWGAARPGDTGSRDSQHLTTETGTATTSVHTLLPLAAVNMSSRHRGDGAKLFYVFCVQVEEAAGLMTSPGSEATHYLGQVTQHSAAAVSSEGMGINIYSLHKY